MDDSISQLVNQMRVECNIDNTCIIKDIESERTILAKCIKARKYLKPQSTVFEKIVKKDLEIGDKVDNTSGDGIKNGVNYEIKCSLWSKKSDFNFIQIRPDHNVQYYIFIGYNLFEGEYGEVYVFKIPSKKIYKLIIKYGGYTHGSKTKLGEITKDTLKGRNCEYALRVNPNIKKGNKYKLLKKMLKYRVEYDKSIF